MEFPLPSFTWRYLGDDLILVDYNKAAIEVTGGKMSEFLNISASELFKHQPEIIKQMWRSFNEKVIIKGDLEYRYSSTGATRFLTSTLVPIPPDSLFVYTEDITDRKAAENELKRSRDELELKVKGRTAELSEINEKLKLEIEERKRAEESLRIRDWAMQSSISGIILMDLDWIVTYVNPSFLNMWGYKDSATVLGISVIELWHEEHKVREILDTLKYTESWVGEVIAKKSDGSMFDVQLSASIVKNEDGEPISIMGSIVDITDRKKLEEELWILSITDSLTGLYNQRQFYRKIEEEATRARRMSYPMCLMIFDLDSFKQYNDRYGHQKGNDVLRDIGEITKNSIRKDIDSAFRYGGDEFAVILPNAGKEDALEVAKRIEKSVSKKYKMVGISFGIELLRDDQTIDDFIRETDVAMYKEKGLKIKRRDKD
jgi:diguanylate cyclase (GGDEF)-like protein/PAS domain S-box-containing protein